MAAISGDPVWVAKKFLTCYFDVLEKHPGHMHRFYKEGSSFTLAMRADASASSDTVYGHQAIQEKITATIQGAACKPLHVDAQFSLNGGILLLVNGTMTLMGLQKTFIQSFFLATQEKGYYVLNDMLQIHSSTEAAQASMLPATAKATADTASKDAMQGFMPPEEVPLQHKIATTILDSAAPALQPSEAVEARAAHSGSPAKSQPLTGESPAVYDHQPSTPPCHKAAPSANAVSADPGQQQQPANMANLTYAQRLKLSMQAGNSVSIANGSPAAVKHSPAAPAAVPEPAPAATEVPTVSANGDHDTDVQGLKTEPTIGIYVKNLPQDEVSSEMLQEAFGKFGAIKGSLDGISIVKSHKFGKVAYITYEDKKAVEDALAASIILGGKKLVVLRMLPPAGSGVHSAQGRGGGRTFSKPGGSKGGRGALTSSQYERRSERERQNGGSMHSGFSRVPRGQRNRSISRKDRVDAKPADSEEATTGQLAAQ